jgi:RNA 2',3'-cyclic 3'-phosphodiesterase
MSGEAQVQRLFVAVTVPEEVKDQIVVARDELRGKLSPTAASWTRPANMHLTLRFLGGVEQSGIESLKTSLAQALSGFGPIPLICERLGCFPDLRYPRVVWAWVYDVAERLTRLHQRVADATAGFTREPAESRFVGHITLARLRQSKRPQAEIIASFVNVAVGRKFGAWTASQVELIRSEVLPGGSRYTTLAGIHL